MIWLSCILFQEDPITCGLNKGRVTTSMMCILRDPRRLEVPMVVVLRPANGGAYVSSSTDHFNNVTHTFRLQF